ncbi:hypothetical protein GNI_050410 [Gregarina niphandrodes]|uniref:Uncharacterized protein n=1 Tax=Gregarina niphandrodes TaxID=110365 RepID=A0A023B9E8_GRENI|nr:hypothetical protein GNI_050410 [Gregarina niphandrodes]EZG72882.1 hypothetical protein GNI_050410 [Gregarina niphandrodes]|eukprot:XP_011129741.1 hypothetical protein GNI_050410 [Gregarina niphandrodes]
MLTAAYAELGKAGSTKYRAAAAARNLLYLASGKSAVHVVDAISCQTLRTYYVDDSEEKIEKILVLEDSPFDSHYFISLSDTGLVRLWNAAGQVLDVLRLASPARDVAVLGMRIFVACMTGNVHEVVVDDVEGTTAPFALRAGRVMLKGACEKGECLTSVSVLSASLGFVGTDDSRLVPFNPSAGGPVGHCIKLPCKTSGVLKRRRIEPQLEPLPAVLDAGVNVFKLAAEQEKQREEAVRRAERKFLEDKNVICALRPLDATTLLVGDSSGQVCLVDATTFTILQEYQEPYRAPVMDITVVDGPRQRSFLTASLSGKVSLYTLTSESEFSPTCVRQAQYSECVAVLVLKPSERIVAVTADGTIRSYFSLKEFGCLRSHGVVQEASTPLENANMYGADNLLLEGAGTKVLIAWGITISSSKNGGKLHAAILERARSALRNPLCQALDKIDTSERPVDVVKIAEVKLRHALTHATVCWSKGYEYVIFVNMTNGRSAFIGLNTQSLEVKVLEKKEKKTIIKTFGKTMITGIWPLPKGDDIDQFLVATATVELNERKHPVVSAGLHLVNWEQDRVMELYRATHDPISRIVVSPAVDGDNRLVLLQSVDGVRPSKLLALSSAGEVTSLVDVQRSANAWAVGTNQLMAVDGPRGTADVYDVTTKTWIHKMFNLKPENNSSPVLVHSAAFVSPSQLILATHTHIFLVDGNTITPRPKTPSQGVRQTIAGQDCVKANIDTTQIIQSIKALGDNNVLVLVTDLEDEAVFKPRLYGCV